mgnify:FL=1
MILWQDQSRHGLHGRAQGHDPLSMVRHLLPALGVDGEGHCYNTIKITPKETLVFEMDQQKKTEQVHILCVVWEGERFVLKDEGTAVPLGEIDNLLNSAAGTPGVEVAEVCVWRAATPHDMLLKCQQYLRQKYQVT